MGVNGIYGLSGSGLDVESLVKVGMLAKQSEYDKMAQKYTKNEWTKAEYLELNSTINTFNNSTLHQYKLQNNMNAKEAESTSSAIKVSASSSAAVATHRVEVTGLSTNAYVISTAKPNRYNSTNNNEVKGMLFQNLTDAGGGKVSGTTADGIAFTADKTANALEFTVANKDGGDTKTISLTYEDILNGATLNDVATQINKTGLNLRADYDLDHDIFSIQNTKSGLDNKLAITVTGKDEYTITNTTNVTKKATQSSWGSTDYTETNDELSSSTESPVTTYQNVAGRTTAKFLNSWGFYQSKDGNLYDPNTTTNDLKSNSTIAWTFNHGVKGTTVNVTNVTYEKYDITGYSGGSLTYTATGNTYSGGTTQNSSLSNNTSGSTKSVSGENSTMKIDGIVYDDIKDNKITINGVTYTAMDRTNGSSAVVNVTQDTDAIIDKVKSFVNDYNKLLSSLYEKYDEKSDSNYKPLTQSQKDSMKEEQITKWEEKAKKGLLYHDQTLGRIIQDMRSAITESVQLDDGSKVSIFSLGISTTGLKGQLELDEDKLKKALEKDPDIVSNVFTHLDKDNNYTRETNGVAQRLGDVFTTATKRIKSRAGSSADITEDSDLNNLMRSLQTRMSNFKKMMNAFETALYKKYDAMEATLAKLGTQLNFVMGGNS